MVNAISIAAVAVVVGLAVYYVYKEKKNGRKCIGCPQSGCCGKKRGGCGCHGEE
ncbi:MAG: FeoB-associated Cys-rich membrane protein [Clostridia bacterium]|nr:FeoB-associated Cys-rich membrane protein [Clostridia bacterium]